MYITKSSVRNDNLYRDYNGYKTINRLSRLHCCGIKVLTPEKVLKTVKYFPIRNSFRALVNFNIYFL